MKHKEKVKMTVKQTFSIFVIALMFMIPVEISYSLSMRDVTVQEVSDRYAIISWFTDKESDSEVIYGINQTELTSIKSSLILTKNHSVMLSPLESSTTYYFNASSANGSEIDTADTETFVTTEEDTKIPFIEVQAPDFASRTTIPISVRTEPNTDVYIYVNSTLESYARSGNDGIVNFVAVRLRSSSAKTTANTVRISAIDPSENRNEITKTIVLDTSPPAVTFNPAIPSGIKTRQLQIKGDSDEPASIEFYLDAKSPANRVAVVNASSPWETLINFPSDKAYALLVYATDRAGNVYSSSFPILVDTLGLQFDTKLDGYSNGHNLNELEPSLVEIITVKGKVNKPLASVTVLVNDKSGVEASRLNLNTGEAVNIPSSVREAVARTTGPRSYVAQADENGIFKIDVQLTKEYTLTSEEGKTLGYSEGDTWENEVEIVVVDQVGNVLKSGKKKIHLNRCGGPGYFTISAPTPSPASIPEPLLKAGVASFGLDFDVKWNGPTSKQDVQIISASITKQTLSQEQIRTKYNLTMGQNGVFTKGTVELFPYKSVDLEVDKAYAFVQLGKTDYDFEPGAVFKPELVFPLKFEIQYTYKLPNGKQSDRQTQVKCIPVSIDVDLEMEDYLNEAGVNKFLDKTITELDTIIWAIDDILKMTKPLQTYAIYGCLGSLVGSFVSDLAIRKTSCIGVDLKKALIEGKINIVYQGNTPTCVDSTDDRLTACCTSTINYMSIRKYSDYICDRIFCPSVPTFEKHVTSYYDEIVGSPSVTSVQTAKTSGEVKSILGNAASKCSFTNNPNPDSDSACESEFQRAWDSILVFNWPKSEYETAYAVQEGAKAKGQGTSFTLDICAKEPDKSVRMFDYGQTYNGQKVVYYVYYVDVEGQNSLKVGRAYLTTYSSTAISGTTGTYLDPNAGGLISTAVTADTANTNSQYLLPISEWNDLVFDADSGICNKEEKGRSCREAVTLSKNPSGTIKLPNEVLAYARSGYDKNYVFNPTSGIVSAARGMCIPAINGYLQSYKNLLTAVRNCFAALRAGERLNAGSCQQLLSEVVCDFIIDAISCAWSQFGNIASKQGTFGGKIFGFQPLDSVVNAGNTISNHITSRYGDTQAFKSLFDEKKLIHSICMGAFTGDWDVEMLNDMFTQATDIPVAPVCVATPAQRRFVTSNPITGQSTYLYTYGGMLSAGSNLQSFSVKLVCSNDNSCSRYGTSSNPNGICDCSGRSKEEFIQVSSDAEVPISVTDEKGGVVYDSPPDYYTVEGGEYRYDKLVIEYTYKNNAGEIKTEKCQANLAERGSPPSTCKLTAAGFRCEVKLGEKGTARFLSEPSVSTYGTKSQPFVVDQAITFPAKIEVLSPKTGNVRKYLRYTVKNHYGAVVSDNYYRLDEGANDLTDKTIYTVERKNFGTTASALLATSEVFGGGLDVSSISGAGNSDFIVVFDASNTASCYAVSGSTISSKLTSTGVFPSINCADVNLRVSGNPVIYDGNIVVGRTSLNEVKSSRGSVISVKSATASTTINNACDSIPREWTARATIYHSNAEADYDATSSELVDMDSVSPNIVSADGKLQQTSEFKFYVACNRGGATTVSAATEQNSVRESVDTTASANAPAASNNQPSVSPTSTPTPTFQAASYQPTPSTLS